MRGYLLLGAFVGVLAGWRFKLAHRAWRDWRRTLASIPVLRRLFYRSAFWSALWVAGALAALWLNVR